MSEVRVIKFNEELFKIPSGTQRKRPDKPIKVKAQRKVSDKTLRNRVLNEIRKNQEKQYHTLLETKTSETKTSETSEGSLGRERSSLGGKDAFNTDFNQSLEYMNQLAGKVSEEQKTKNTTLRTSLANTGSEEHSYVKEDIANLIPVNMEPFTGDESVVLKPALYPPVPYGCLKGGSLPTYRAYHNTLKNTNTIAQPIREPAYKPSTEPSTEPLVVEHSSLEQPVIAERIVSPTEIAMQEKARQELVEKSKPKVKRIKKLLRRTYRAGKDKYKPRIGVLLPNKTLRSNVTTKAYMLKQTPIEEIRKTLVKKGFIKHGSSAPNDVLRKIYESIQMIGGEVSNYNADNLLYNFFESKEHA
jgi:hypothetical protein